MSPLYFAQKPCKPKAASNWRWSARTSRQRLECSRVTAALRCTEKLVNSRRLRLRGGKSVAKPVRNNGADSRPLLRELEE